MLDLAGWRRESGWSTLTDVVTLYPVPHVNQPLADKPTSEPAAEDELDGRALCLWVR